MSAVLITNNLLFSSQVASAAAKAGIELKSLSSVENFHETADGASLLLVDLSTPGMRITDLVARARTLDSPPTEIVAFGPHVHEARLMAARTAGCNQVLSQGAFSTEMNAILTRAAQREQH